MVSSFTPRLVMHIGLSLGKDIRVFLGFFLKRLKMKSCQALNSKS